MLAPITRSVIVAFALLVLVPGAATAADETSPVTLDSFDDADGPIFNVGFRTLEDLHFEYVEEEYLVSGAATVYTYAEDPVREEKIPLVDDVPYTTRMIVRRPQSHGVFNGTVVIEWWNSTAGFDTSPAWDASAEYFGRTGTAYVGVTNSTTSFGFLVGGCRLFGILPPMCGTRYSALEMPENGQAFEMLSQIANLLKSDAANNPFPENFEVERIYHVGQSQQGGSMVTYATAFHFPVNDGYFIQAAGSARPINFGPACGGAGSPPYPDCTPRLEGDERRVRTDLPVPVYRAQTGTDMSGVLAGDSRQSDTDTFRYYEMAGTAHSVIHKDVEVPGLGIFLEDFCQFEMNTLGDGPVFGSYLYNAMWRNMEQQVISGKEPPHGELIEVVAGEVARDEFGNGLGGIRLPQLDVPIATYGPNNSAEPSLPPFLIPIANLACRLSGTVTPLDAETLDELYPNHGSYVSQIAQRSNELAEAGFLLPKDASKLKVDAALSHIGCGIGFELAFLLPPILWLRERRRRRL
jgi:hypothetical protein